MAKATICRKHHDLTGKTFGRLTVRAFDHRSAHGALYWRCRCVCGNEKSVRSSQLTGGKCRSCGCLITEAHLKHGAARHSYETHEYNIWRGMRQRCLNPRNPTFLRYYGIRGIRIAERWNNFTNFLADMGPKPPGRISLERIDNDGDYEPGNVCWATQKAQMRNTRRNRLLTHDGITMCLTDWALRVGMSRDMIGGRLDRLGWSVEKALTRPPSPNAGCHHARRQK